MGLGLGEAIRMDSVKAQNAFQQGMVHLRSGNLEEAERAFRKVLRFDERNFGALNLLAVVLMQGRRFAEAERPLKAASALDPGHVATIYNYALVLRELGRPAEALALLDRAVGLVPNDAEAWNNRGLALNAVGRRDDAVASYDKALALNPRYADAHYNRANVLRDLGRTGEAAAAYDAALAAQPSHRGARTNRAGLLQLLDRHEEAAAAFDAISRADPADFEALVQSLHSEMRVASWANYPRKLDAICRGLAGGVYGVSPLPLHALPVDRGALLRSAQSLVRGQYPPPARPLWNGTRYRHDRPRIGYFSADFHNHATSFLMAELFERHDRQRFEVHAFSFGPNAADAMRTRLVAAFEHFHELSGATDEAIAARARELEIDIAVDLKGFTAGARPGVFARRPAPVQVNYLGFPGTMGADFIDYIVADPVLIPPDHAGDYAEKIVRMPHSYQVNDGKRPLPGDAPPRSALGLPERGVVFCCLNNNFKITPDVFDVWMRLLAKVEGSVLWLLADSPAAERNLRSEAQARGIAPERLVFAARAPLAEHIARQRQADLFVDTFYYTGHTTTSDALWVGLPVVTCLGETFAARVSASLLQACGMAELVTRSPAEYEATALRLASNPDELSAVRAKLASNRTACPLFDAALFARHIEDAYTQMWQRSREGRKPDHLAIAP